MILGAAYYPEFYNNWDRDIELMAELGFKVVRMAEFSWCVMEPQEGKFEFEWLEKVINKFSKKGIKTILGTPTGSPPQWLSNKYSDLAVTNIKKDANSISGGFGNYCKNHPDYREYSQKIVYAMVNYFKDNQNVIMYQIDNEFMGTPCYCDNCKNAYIEWVKNNYNSIDDYNEKLMTIFQGRKLNSFEDIRLPISLNNVVNPAVLVDYKKFVSNSYIEYCKLQVDIIKKLSPKTLVTTNFCTLFNDFDHFEMAKMFDVGGIDTYPKADMDYSLRNSFKLDLTRALKKKNFWVLEQQCSPVAFREYNYSLEPLEARLYTYKSIGHGADGIVYFRFNTPHSGGERYGAGILRHDEEKGRIFYEVKQICDEINLLKDMLENSEKSKAKIAIMYSNLSAWVMSEGKKISKDIDYITEIKNCYKCFLDKNIDIDFVTINDDLSMYQLVIAPCLASVSKQDGEHLKSYINNGGKCIFTYFSGMFNEYNNITKNFYLGELRELLGIKITEWAVPYKDKNYTFTFKDKIYPAETLNMVVQNESATVLGNFNHGYYKNNPSVTENKFGKGRAYYVATGNSAEFLYDFVNSIINLNNPLLNNIIGENIDIKVREKGDKKLIIVMNHYDFDKTIELKEKFTNALTGKLISGKVTLKAFDVLLLYN